MSLTTRSSSVISKPASPDADDGGRPLLSNPGRAVTETPNPFTSESSLGVHCNCKQGCITSHCACRKNGASCSTSCLCLTLSSSRTREALPCASVFTRELHKYFGGTHFRALHGDAWSWDFFIPKIAIDNASACFTKHLDRGNVRSTVTELKNKLMAPCDAYEIDPFLAAWLAVHKSKIRREVGEERLKEHLEILFLYGLRNKHSYFSESTGDDGIEGGSHTWSFCRDAWVLRSAVKHCWICNKCYENAWHCGKCGVCKTGRNLACGGCGGWSKIGAIEGTDEGYAMTAKAGRAAQSGKRKRDSLQGGSHADVRLLHG